MFERIIGISQNTPGEPFVKFMRTAEWNGLVRKDKNIRRAVLETMQSIPDERFTNQNINHNIPGFENFEIRNNGINREATPITKSRNHPIIPICTCSGR